MTSASTSTFPKTHAFFRPNYVPAPAKPQQKKKWNQPVPQFYTGFGSEEYSNPANGHQLNCGRRTLKVGIQNHPGAAQLKRKGQWGIARNRKVKRDVTVGVETVTVRLCSSFAGPRRISESSFFILFVAIGSAKIILYFCKTLARIPTYFQIGPEIEQTSRYGDRDFQFSNRNSSESCYR